MKTKQLSQKFYPKSILGKKSRRFRDDKLHAYEDYKSYLWSLNLTSEQYEQRIRYAVESLGL